MTTVNDVDNFGPLPPSQASTTSKEWFESDLVRGYEWLETLVNVLPCMIAFVDREERYRFNSDGYRRWLGKEPAELYGQSVRSVLGVAVYDKIKCRIRRALAGEVVEYYDEIPYESGIKYVHAIYTPFYEGREVVGIFVIVSDISNIGKMTNDAIRGLNGSLDGLLRNIDGMGGINARREREPG